MAIEGMVLSELVAAFGTPGLLVFCMWYFTRGGSSKGPDVAAKIHDKLDQIDSKVDGVGKRVTVLEVKLDERSKMWYPSNS